MARAGRKRQAGARRRATTRAGRRPDDRGTPELRGHRARLVGGRFSDDPKAAEPLGILALAGVLTPAQVDAGWRLAVLRWRLFGKPMPVTRIYERYLSGSVGLIGDAELDVAAEAQLRRRYEAADAALQEAGLLARREVQAACVEQRLPDWFWRARLGQSVVGDAAARLALQVGLTALDRHWRGAPVPDSRRGG